MGKVGKNPESTPIRLRYFRNRLRKVGRRCNVRSRSELSEEARSRPESPGVARSPSRPESSGVFRNRRESPGVVRSWPESESFGVVRNSSESSESFGVVRSRPESFQDILMVMLIRSHAQGALFGQLSPGFIPILLQR